MFQSSRELLNLLTKFTTHRSQTEFSARNLTRHPGLSYSFLKTKLIAKEQWSTSNQWLGTKKEKYDSVGSAETKTNCFPSHSTSDKFHKFSLLKMGPHTGLETSLTNRSWQDTSQKNATSRAQPSLHSHEGSLHPNSIYTATHEMKSGTSTENTSNTGLAQNWERIGLFLLKWKRWWAFFTMRCLCTFY